jgi:hypothetical protein
MISQTTSTGSTSSTPNLNATFAILIKQITFYFEEVTIKIWDIQLWQCINEFQKPMFIVK